MDAIFTINNIYFDIISIIVLVTILLGAIEGCVKGFLYSIIKFARTFVIFLAGIFLAKPLAEAILSSSLGQGWVTTLGTQIEEIHEIFAQPLTGGDQLQTISEALKMMNVPEILLESLSEFIFELNQLGGLSLGMVMAQGIINYVLIAASFFAILLVLSIIFAIILKIAKAINKAKVLGFVNRLLGLVFGLIVTYVTLDIIIYLISLVMMTNNVLTNTFTEILNLNKENVVSISKFMYTNNITRYVLSILL